jgi:hypothetical protein
MSEIVRSDGDTEDQFVEKIKKFLSTWFFIKEQVWSTDKKSRIDIVIINKIDKRIKFGLEVKRFDHKKGHGFGEHLLQGFRYILSEFIIDGEKCVLPVVLVPPFSYEYFGMKDHVIIHQGKEYFCDRHGKDNEHHSINGWLGAFGIGEFRKIIVKYDKEYTYFIISFSNWTVWTNRKDTESIKYEHYEKILNRIEKIKEIFKLVWNKN